MRLRATLILLTLFLASFPCIYGWLHPPQSGSYTGIRSINASDYNQNLSFIEQSREGSFFLKNQLTSEPHQSFLVRPVYFVLSLMFRGLPISNTAVYHILRLMSGFALCICLFLLIRSYLPDDRTSNYAFAILALTSGLGILLNRTLPTTDLSIPESILFVSFGEAPHFSYSLGFLWTALTFLYLAIRTSKSLLLIPFYVCDLILWYEHPFEALTLTLLGGILIWQYPDRKIRVLFLFVCGMIAFPAYLYYQKLMSIPAFSGWGSNQNLMISPSILSVLGGYLPQILFAGFGIWKSGKDPSSRAAVKFLVLWIIVQLVIIYLPFSFQRRLIAGVQFPLALLAALGIVAIQPPSIRVVLILLMMSTNLFLVIRETGAIRNGGMPYYLPDSYKRAFEWLSAQKEGAVMSEFVTGNFIPAYTGLPSFMGHSSFTPNIAEKRGMARQFFRSGDVSILKENHIRYVFWGLEERRIARPPADTLLIPLYQDSGITIFKVPQH